MEVREAFEHVIGEVLKSRQQDHFQLSRFNSIEFCLDDILSDKQLMRFLKTIVEPLSRLQGRLVKAITFHVLPPSAVDGHIGYFSVELDSLDNYIRKCDGNHAGPACRDSQCWVRGI